jgi:propanol-preferring alcohol dehydrogenase
MKAAVVHDFARPLAIEDVPTPEPGAEQVLVRIEASGLCHTDIHAARGEWPVRPTPPFIPGHEGVGIVQRVGAGNAHGLEEGMRVALRGSATPAATANSATAAGRRSACRRRTRATR